ncbi:hypothetical protein F5Y16DRAFT_384742 [Xylariaceae sp. FL0255]|nr:hypothetical protein F5Y16DRAFT_384742 [Xylariaceae sp. FL0255]
MFDNIHLIFSLAYCAFSACYFIISSTYVSILASKLRKVPGPISFAITKWWLAYPDFKATRMLKIHICVRSSDLQYELALMMVPLPKSYFGGLVFLGKLV